MIMDRNTDNTNKFTVVCTKWGIKHLSNWISPGLSFAMLTLVVVTGRCKLASVIRWASHGSQSTGPQPIGSHLVSFHNSYNCYLRLLGLKMMRQESQQGPSDNGNAKRRKISSSPRPKVYAVWNNKVEHSAKQVPRIKKLKTWWLEWKWDDWQRDTLDRLCNPLRCSIVMLSLGDQVSIIPRVVSERRRWPTTSPPTMRRPTLVRGSSSSTCARKQTSALLFSVGEGLFTQYKIVDI